MARHAPARALSASACRQAGRYDVSVATPLDDSDIRRLLREHPLGGNVRLTLEREPESGISGRLEGDVHQTLIARERGTGRLAAIGSRAVRDAFVNGRRIRLGYFGQLRIAAPFRATRGLLEAGFACCRSLHTRDEARVYLTSVTADNDSARRLLSGVRCESAPRFMPAGSLHTLVVARRSGRTGSRRPVGVEIRRGSRDLLPDVVALLASRGRRHQFAPCWDLGTLCSSERTPDLRGEDFVVALRGRRVVGCLAIWDQRRFKQVVVRGYSAHLARWRGLINAVGRLTGVPRLPAVNERLEFAYLSHLAVEDDETDVALSLMDAARASLASDIDYLVTGFGEGSSLLDAVRHAFRHREYRTLLFLAFWRDGEALARALDARVPHPEVAIL